MKTNCGRFSALLGAYADGELDPVLADQVRVHVASCAECRRELDVLHQLHQLTRKAGSPELHDDYWDWHRTRVWRRLNQDTRERQRFYRPSFVWPKLATLAGGLVVVLVVAVVGWQALGPGLLKHGEHASADRLLVTSVPPSATGRADTERPAPVVEKVSSGGNAELAHAEVADQSEAGRVTRAARTEERRSPPGAVAPAAQRQAGATTVAANKAETCDKDHARHTARKRDDVSPAGTLREMSDNEMRETSVESLAALLKGGAVFQTPGVKPQVADVRPVQQRVQPVPATDDTGTAIVGLAIDTLGAVVDVHIVRSSGKPQLDSIALALARKSRFSPGKRAGKPARFDLELPYRFNKLAQRKRSK